MLKKCMCRRNNKNNLKKHNYNQTVVIEIILKMWTFTNIDF